MGANHQHEIEELVYYFTTGLWSISLILEKPILEGFGGVYMVLSKVKSELYNYLRKQLIRLPFINY